MNRTPTPNSTRIHSVGYDIPRHVLEVEFRDGSVRRYMKVAQEVYERLMHAQPVDRYFDEKIEGRNQLGD